MPRVLPTDVVTAADRMFPDMARAPTSFPGIEVQRAPNLAALARLVDAVPTELVRLDPTRYAGLVAAVAYLQALPTVFQASRQPIQLRLTGYDSNVVALIREAMAECPEESPASGTTTLSFINDPILRESIRLDISAATRNLAEGEWKGATVLAGSATEALLLWAIQQHPSADVTSARSRLKKDPGPDLEWWHLPSFVAVAHDLGLIKEQTATQAGLAADFRNFIHPGKTLRTKEQPSRGTAHAALAAVEFVVRDLTPS